MFHIRSGFFARLLALTFVLPASLLHAQDEATPAPAPVQVEGRWCGAGFLRGTSLTLSPHSQEFEGTLVRGDRTRNVDGRIDGATLRTSPASAGRAGELVLQLQGDKLRIVTAGGPLVLIQGMSFFRAGGSGC
jgi:hypothetical protein